MQIRPELRKIANRRISRKKRWNSLLLRSQAKELERRKQAEKKAADKIELAEKAYVEAHPRLMRGFIRSRLANLDDLSITQKNLEVLRILRELGKRFGRTDAAQAPNLRRATSEFLGSLNRAHLSKSRRENSEKRIAELGQKPKTIRSKGIAGFLRYRSASPAARQRLKQKAK